MVPQQTFQFKHLNLPHARPGAILGGFYIDQTKGVILLWIPLLALPAAAALIKLGSAFTMLSVLSIALQAAGVFMLLLTASLVAALFLLHRRR
jgi:hypothetical protein